HESIVVDGTLGQDHAPRGEVDVANRIAPEAEPARPPDVADRLHDVAWLHQGRRDLRKQGREEQVVPVTDQQQLDVGPAAEPTLEDANRLQPGEAATEYHDACHGRRIPTAQTA